MLTTSGEALFARYAFPPNDLGHCGPPGAEVLLAGGASGVSDPALRERAPQFDGAWPYLRLLATTAGVDDALDAQVVAAYWRGGNLLDHVDTDAFTAAVLHSFGDQPGVRERLAEAPEVATTGPGHAFHVFVVYPWVGMLGSASDVPRSVLDSCRVRWGTVKAVHDETATVGCRPLTWDGRALGLGPERVETFRWSRDRHAFVRQLQPGDHVSLHWDWVCDRLDDDDVTELTDRTLRQLSATNRWLEARQE